MMFKWGRSTAKEDYDQAVAYYKKGNYKKAIKWYKKAAEEGLADQLKIRRNIYLFALWFQYAKSHREEAVNFLFDSIQNTSLISVQSTALTKSPNEKIRSLFMSSEEGKMMDLFWDDNSWNPISSGIILSN